MWAGLERRGDFHNKFALLSRQQTIATNWFRKAVMDQRSRIAYLSLATALSTRDKRQSSSEWKRWKRETETPTNREEVEVQDHADAPEEEARDEGEVGEEQVRGEEEEGETTRSRGSVEAAMTR